VSVVIAFDLALESLNGRFGVEMGLTTDGR
jgi:hypothetical protein